MTGRGIRERGGDRRLMMAVIEQMAPPKTHIHPGTWNVTLSQFYITLTIPQKRNVILIIAGSFVQSMYLCS